MQGGRITSEEKSTLSTYVGLIVVTVLAAALIYFFLFEHKETKQMTGFDPNRAVPADSVLKRKLRPEAYRVVRENGTEMPFQNAHWDEKRPGIYADVTTGEPLFTSLDKYDAGLGMPTFGKPISKDLVVEQLDTSHEMQRTEVHAKRSNAHLGHVFPDTQSPTGQRYVMNSAAFHFIPVENMKNEGYEAFLPLLDKK